MYQSLHTTVIGSQGIPFEVQIRTWEMHHTAEYGIAAHWKYKLGMTSGNEKPDSLEGRLQWIRNMLDNQSESEDITDLSNYFVTSDGEDFLTILLHALEKAKDVNEDVNIESM